MTPTKKPSFRELRALAKKRQAKDLAQIEPRKRLMHGEVGNELFKIKLDEAARTQNVHGPNGLIELRAQVRDLYRSYLQLKKAEKNEALKFGYAFLLKRQRSLIHSIDGMIREIEQKK